MSTPFIGEIRMFGGTFAPRGFAFCEGQILPIVQNTALFSLLGTTYGGNGITTYALPDLRGRMPMGAGQGPGLSNRDLGQAVGQSTVTLTPPHLPAHSHGMRVSAGAATTATPSPGVTLASTSGAKVYRDLTNPVATAAPLTPSGAGLPHENRQPFLGINFIIALNGVFPSRN